MKTKKPIFLLSYETLQEIHTLNGMVCGWNMSLPKKMIQQAKKVHGLMLELKQCPTGRKSKALKKEGKV